MWSIINLLTAFFIYDLARNYILPRARNVKKIKLFHFNDRIVYLDQNYVYHDEYRTYDEYKDCYLVSWKAMHTSTLGDTRFKLKLFTKKVGHHEAEPIKEYFFKDKKG